MPRIARRGDRTLDLRGPALVDVGEHVILAVRHDRLEGLPGPHVLAADDAWDLEALALELTRAALQLLPLRRAGRVALDRLVPDLRQAEDPGRAHRRGF